MIMIVRRWAAIIFIVVSLFLIFGCGREKRRNDFDLGTEHFQKANYKEAMIRLEIWLKENPGDEYGVNTQARVMLVIMYHDDEVRQRSFETEFKKLQALGKPGMAAILQMIQNPTVASRLGIAISDILVKGGDLAVPALIKDLTGTNPRLRAYARNVLINIGKPSVNSLIQLLDNPDLYNRSRAVEALNRIGDKSAIKPLEAKLNDSSKLVQIQAAAALYGMGQKDATQEFIFNCLDSNDVQCRRVAARAIGEIIDDPPLKLVLKAVKDADADVRSYAARAAGKTLNLETIQPLMKMLQEDESDQARASAAESLEKIGKPVVTPLIKLLENANDMELTIRIVQILGNIGDKKAVKPLEKIYNGTSNTVLQNETAKALNNID